VTEIFISYRRSDAGLAGRLYDWLDEAFPNKVFMDSDMSSDVDYVRLLEETIAGSCVVIAGRRGFSVRYRTVALASMAARRRQVAKNCTCSFDVRSRAVSPWNRGGETYETDPARFRRDIRFAA
jgi:hypothetical protein